MPICSVDTLCDFCLPVANACLFIPVGPNLIFERIQGLPASGKATGEISNINISANPAAAVLDANTGGLYLGPLPPTQKNELKCTFGRVSYTSCLLYKRAALLTLLPAMRD